MIPRYFFIKNGKWVAIPAFPNGLFFKPLTVIKDVNDILEALIFYDLQILRDFDARN